MIFFTHASEGLAHTLFPSTVVKLQTNKNKRDGQSRSSSSRTFDQLRLSHSHDGGPDALLAGPDVALHFSDGKWFSAKAGAAFLRSKAAYGYREKDS